MELFDERSSTKVFYKTLNRESPGEELENVQSDSELGEATTRADQEIVDVILSGRVSTASVLLPCASLPRRVLTSPFQTECHVQPVWEFSGRVRISDGLVVLVRQSVRHRLAVSPSDKSSNGRFHVEKRSTSFDLCRLRCVCDLFRVGGGLSALFQQCCPRRTLLANGSTALLAPSGKVFGAYAKQISVNEEASRSILSYLQSGQEAACSPSHSSWRALGLASSTLAPFRMRARALYVPALDLR